jgi:hypothetical protein
MHSESDANKKFKSVHQNEQNDEFITNLDDNADKQSNAQPNASRFLVNDALLTMYAKYSNSGYRFAIDNEGVYSACIELLYILKRSNAPLYLYDQIIQWAKTAMQTHNVNFATNSIPNRSQIVESCKKQFDLKHIEPFEKGTCLCGSTQKSKWLSMILYHHCTHYLLMRN